jgi:glutathione S-transferase
MGTPRGILTETPAPLAYIAQSLPEARLAPLDEPFAFAQLQAFNSYLCSTLHVAHAHRRRGHRWPDEPASFADMQRKVPRSVSVSLIRTRFPPPQCRRLALQAPGERVEAPLAENDFACRRKRAAPVLHSPQKILTRHQTAEVRLVS